MTLSISWVLLPGSIECSDVDSSPGPILNNHPQPQHSTEHHRDYPSRGISKGRRLIVLTMLAIKFRPSPSTSITWVEYLLSQLVLRNQHTVENGIRYTVASSTRKRYGVSVSVALITWSEVLV